MKWSRASSAPEYKVLLVQGRFHYRAPDDDSSKPSWTDWVVFTATRSSNHWDVYPPRSNFEAPKMQIRMWTECPTGPRVHKPDPVKRRIAQLERDARDEELRRQGWRMKRRRPKVTTTVIILEASLADYGPYREYKAQCPGGRLPQKARAWRPLQWPQALN